MGGVFLIKLLKFTWSLVLVLAFFICGMLISDYQHSRIEEDIHALQAFLFELVVFIKNFLSDKLKCPVIYP